jgi:hypothetical protein
MVRTRPNSITPDASSSTFPRIETSTLERLPASRICTTGSISTGAWGPKDFSGPPTLRPTRAPTPCGVLPPGRSTSGSSGSVATTSRHAGGSWSHSASRTTRASNLGSAASVEIDRNERVICHPYRCVFVHVPKSAGISIEHVFLGLLGLTWETRGPLLLRHNNDPRRDLPAFPISRRANTSRSAT